MRVEKVIRRRVRSTEGSVQFAGDLNAVIAANVGETAGSHQQTSSEQRVSIVQTGGRTSVRHHSAKSAARPNKEA
ncbi:MAG: hypothetical protein NVSMB29_17990 [Candidatus Dormibacteria bacterium]